MQITLTGYADLISIHALREEGDEFIDFILEALSNFYPRPPRGGRLRMLLNSALISLFLSTPSARRATYFFFIPSRLLWISIHALREEGDVTQRIKGAWPTYFYPRPPRGGRQCSQSNRLGTKKFLSTPSARRATRLRGADQLRQDISIHALREEGDHADHSHRLR